MLKTSGEVLAPLFSGPLVHLFSKVNS